MNMPDHTADDPAAPAAAAAIGVIEEVSGPVVDIACYRLPPLYQNLCVEMDGGQPCMLEVHRHLDEKRVRTVALHATAGLRRSVASG